MPPSSEPPIHTLPTHSAAEELLLRTLPAEPGHYDELRQSGGDLRPAWAAFADHLGAPLGELAQRQAVLARQIQEDGVSYNVYSAQGGPSRPWSLETLPLLISPDDWRTLERGVAQRAKLLNRVLQDCYGEQTLLKKAMLPSALVLGHPGYVRGLQGVQPLGGIYLHVVAFDLARGPDGLWWVVSQRTQAPSGLGYVMQNRLLVSRLFPDAYRGLNVQHLATGYRRLVDALSKLAAPCAGGATPRLALLTPGPYNETYFEHAYLARYLGLPLVEGSDLVVRHETLYLKTVQGLEPIHGLLRRLDDDFCDPLEMRSDSTLGIPGLMQVVRAGNVVLGNALGAGFLESPAVHGFLPALSEHLLGEELLLASLDTWWCGERSAWQQMRGELTRQVLRPSYPYAGIPGFGSMLQRQRFDAVIGQTLLPQAVQAWRERIDREPAAYTVQSFVPYAQAPVWSGEQLHMRGASLRVYALFDGEGGWRVLPGGMTRIATRDAGPVSMQLGGSSLDTWVMTEGQVDAFSMVPKSVPLDELVQRQRPVASRTGENLYWMGRYTERSEQQLCLVKSLISLQANEDDTHDAVQDTLSVLAYKNGLVPAGTPGLATSARAFARAVLNALGDPTAKDGAYSLGYNLQALERSTQVLRERLSPEHARLLRSLGSDFQHKLRHSGLQGLGQAQEALDHLGMQLAAVTGAQTDRMTRDVGWRLLTVGRLVERLIGYSLFLQAFWKGGALLHAQGFEQVLVLFDSTITFRARFQRRFESPALLALLVMDESNPRALACVLRRLRTELGKLPARQDNGADLLALLPNQGMGVTLPELCNPIDGHERVLALLSRLIEVGGRLSDEVGRRYFAHAETTDSMVSA